MKYASYRILVKFLRVLQLFLRCYFQVLFLRLRLTKLQDLAEKINHNNCANSQGLTLTISVHLFLCSEFFSRLRIYSPSSMLVLRPACKRTQVVRWKIPDQEAKEARHHQPQARLVVLEECCPRHVRMKKYVLYACWKWLKVKVWQAVKVDVTTDCISTAWKYVSLLNFTNNVPTVLCSFCDFKECTVNYWLDSPLFICPHLSPPAYRLIYSICY